MQSKKLYVIDVSNPTSLSVVGQTAALYASSDDPHLAVDGRYAYVLNTNGGTNSFQVIDISNSSSPAPTNGTLTITSPHALVVRENFVYITTANGLSIVNASNPASPAIAASLAYAGGSAGGGIFLQGNYAYIHVIDSVNGNVLRIVDISSPTSPVNVGTVPTGATGRAGGLNQESRSVFVQGRYAYLVDSAANQLVVFDLGGAYIQQFTAGGIETDTLSVRNNLQIGNDTSMRGGLSISGGLGVFYPSGFYASSTEPALKLVQNSTGAIFQLFGGSTNVFSVLNTGNVGIGNTSPTYKLDVTGAGHFTSYVDASHFVATSSATASIFNGGFLSLASSTIGNGTQTGGLTISGGATTTGNAYFAGNVGIGTAAPTDKLEIAAANSQVRLTDTDDSHFGQISYSSGLFALRANSTSADHFFLTEGGKVGIGTSNPSGTLHISTSTADQLYLQRTGSFTGKYRLGIAGANNNFYIYDDAQSQTRLVINGSGNVGIGTTTPYSRLTVWGPDTAAGTAAFLIANSASTTEFAVYDDGSATLAGTLTQNSDVRLKINVESLNASSTLGLIAQLNPVIFHWADPAKSSTPQLGFIAQDVQKVFPQLVSTTSPTAQTPDGTLGLNYIGFIAPIVEAIKALMAEVNNLTNTVADFAESVTSKQITATNELCVGSTCVTEAQFKAMVAGANQSASSNGDASPSSTGQSSSPPSVDTEPPVITINGNNPAIINVGDTYDDLGASVSDNVDPNIGIHTFVGSTPIEFAAVETSAPATYHINYVATDAAGNTATSTRTVIIESADISPPPAIDISSAASTTAH